jgi:glycosyltransferase involved in cell wall biosynthesis
MKILYYSPHPNLALNSNSGYGTHMREMIAAFRRAGHTVEPIIMGGDEETYSSDTAPSTKRKTLNLIKKGIPQPLWQTVKDLRLRYQDHQFESKLGQKVEAVKPDLIYERANYLQPSGVRTANRLGIPHVLEVNSPYVEERKTLGNGGSLMTDYAARIEQELLEETDVVAVISSSLKEYLERKYGLQNKNFVTTPNAINESKIKWNQEEVDKIRYKYNLENRIVLGFVGSLLPWHGVDLLIKSFQKIRQQHANTKVLIVGDGSGVNELKQLSQHLGIEDDIIFTGRVPHVQVFNYIQAMDITVYPGSKDQVNWYGSPVKLFEYGAMGKPIVIYDQPPIRDVMEPGKDGLLIEPEVKQLIDAFNKLINNETLCQKIAQNFKEKVISQYTWERNVERVLNSIEINKDT